MNQKFLPLGGINLSTSLSLVPPTDYTAAFNCHISNDSEGKAGAITNIMGNVATSISYLETNEQSPYAQYLKADAGGGLFLYSKIAEFNGVATTVGAEPTWEEFFFTTHKGRVVGTYEEPERRRLYYLVAWDGFTYRETTLLTPTDVRKNTGILALLCFEQYETISDYFILQENGSIVITDDGDFLVNEASEDGDLLGQTYMVGMWGFGDETYTWDDNFVITGIGKVGNELTWVMNEKYDPMTIDVERGILTYQPSYVSEYKADNSPYVKVDPRNNNIRYFSTSAFTDFAVQDVIGAYLRSEDFTFIKRGGLRPPVVVADFDASIPRILGSNVLQFAYRYVYDNGYRSVLSPYSQKVRSAKVDADDYYNRVTITLPLDEELPSTVSKVEVCVRSGAFDSTDSGWTVIESKDRADVVDVVDANQMVYSVVYTGERLGEQIDALSAAQVFDAVPLRAEALEVTSNRVFMGNVIPAGSYDMNASDDFNVTFSTVAATSTLFSGEHMVFDIEEFENDPEYGGGGVQQYTKIFLVVNTTPNVYNGIYAIPDGYGLTEFITNAMPTSYPNLEPSNVLVSWSGTTKSTRAQINAALRDYLEYSDYVSFTVDTNAATNSQTDPTLPKFGSSEGGTQYKGGGSYQFGIIPFDSKGRTTGVVTREDWVVDIPERTYLDVATVAAVKALFVAAPSWCTHFAFARTKCLNISSFKQYKGAGTSSVTFAKSKRVDDVTGYELTTQANADYLAVSLKGLQRQGQGFEMNTESRYRVLIKDAVNEVETTPIALHIDGNDDLYLICTFTEYTCPAAEVDQPLIEIRELIPQNAQPLFYETMQFGKRSAGQTFIMIGDTQIQTDQSGAIAIEGENTDPSKDYFIDINLGRTFIAAPDQSQRRLGDRIYYSGIARPEASRTFLNSVNALHYKETSDNGGDIQRLIMTSTTDIYGQVMLAIAETNTTSIYLGETLVRGKDGNMQTTASSEVIGGMSEVRGMYGTAHRMSVAAYQGTVCWYDVNKGAVVMYSSQGIEVISDMGMSNYFRTMADFVRPLNLAATINRRYNQYHITIGADSDRPVRDLNGYTAEEGTVDNPFEYADGFVLVFDMDTKRWMTALTMDPEAMSSIGVLPAQFNEGRLWLQKSASRNKFFGVTSPSKIAVVLNAPPESVKVPEAISVESDEVPTHVYIQNLRPYQQQTDIDSTEFREREGVFYAPVLRDRLTGDAQTDEQYIANLLSGEKIRGQYIQIALIMDYPDDDFEVNAINVKFNISSGHSTGRTQR